MTAGVDEDHNVTLVSNQIQKELDKIKLPDGYEISMTGEDETCLLYTSQNNKNNGQKTTY